MSDGRTGYGLLYRLGIRPWELDDTPAELAAMGDEEGDPPPGRALDLGCGSGRAAVRLAGRGWEVVGVDFVEGAVRRARERAAAAAVNARFVVGDVTRLPELDLGGPFDLVSDVKCFHGLAESGRVPYVAGVSALCRPGAPYLLYALEPGRLRRAIGAPAGIAADEVRRLFGPHFEVQVVRPPRPAPFEPAYYRMRRRPDP